MGAEVNAPASDEGGRTALQAAAGSGYLPIVELLLKKGAKVNAPASRGNGRTALQAAAESRADEGLRLHIAALLVKAGADVNAPGYERNGRTACWIIRTPL